MSRVLMGGGDFVPFMQKKWGKEKIEFEEEKEIGEDDRRNRKIMSEEEETETKAHDVEEKAKIEE